METKKLAILAKINFIDKPERKIIIKPERKISIDVPRSGCLNIIEHGIAKIKNAIACVL